MRLPFADWGGFDAGTVRCQRVLARAAAQCAETAWIVRRECREGESNGGPACVTDMDPRILAASSAAATAVDDACSERQYGNLQFLGFFDSRLDLTNFCRHGWPDAADSLVFATAIESGAPAEPCIEASADAASAVMRYVFHSRRLAMDHAASGPRSSAARLALLSRAERGKAAATARIAARLAARCPDFAARYTRTPAAFVALLATRADCIGGDFYIQDAVVCPAPVCGNGVIEYPLETCDDGNIVDGDRCPADCGANQ
ncbi:MAG: hypothetical protein ABI629_25230, partial [bacterium]